MEPIPPEALLANVSPDRQAVANELRRLVKRAVPTSVERVRAGWGLIGYDLPVGRRTRFFAWVWPQAEHVHLGFVNGMLIDDPGSLLSGDGVTKQARWLTVTRLEEIHGPAFEELVRAAAAIAGMSRSELIARKVDREERAAGESGD